MVEGESSASRKKRKNRAVLHDYGFSDTLFSWSLDDVFNDNLFKEKVEKIPVSFQSIKQYFGSYVFPLLEETRAQMFSSMNTISRAPFAKVVDFEESKPYGKKLYDVKVDDWNNSNHGKEPYKMLPGDILFLTDAKPETASDLQRVERMQTFVIVTKVPEDENETDPSSTCFKVRAAKDIQADDKKKSLFVIFLSNITPNRRIWNSLHMQGNLEVIKEILCTDAVVEQHCKLHSVQSEGIWDEISCHSFLSTLNDSQREAIFSCLGRICSDINHKATVDLIWGPPGTGKTKTISMLLFILLKMNCRTLACAPTNVAIKELAFRVLTLAKDSVERDSRGNTLFYPLGEFLLLGNNERLKVDAGIEEIYLDYRIKRLAECFAPFTGWRRCFDSMIVLIENCVSQYHTFLENELMKEREGGSEHDIKEGECWKEIGGSKPFLQYVRERFKCTATPLRNCIFNFCTHLPKSYILENNFQDMVALINLLYSLETLLMQDNVVSEELEELFSLSVAEYLSETFLDKKYLLHLHQIRSECHSVLRKLSSSFNELDLPSGVNKGLLKDFCLRKASLIFCTASRSFELHSVAMEPLNFLVIDEAAQLKESESTIPLQLSGIKHAILIGDECQLPAMVESNVSDEAGFGKSLFERLSYLGYSKHMLSTQYRMHPSISFFPNSYFYDNKIFDSPNVKSSYEKCYLQGQMYGPYSFINIVGGREEFIDHSCRNMVEVSAVMKIVQNLCKAWILSKQKISIGIVSPYTAQVVAIQEKLGCKYQNSDGFSVKVKSIDGFQGGEEDIIIISTVRSNSSGSIGFLTKPQRINVALTRARHCLWILGNERTLTRSESIWETLVRDAKARQFFFNADEDKDLAKAILEAKKELNELDELLYGKSVFFKSPRWKVIFSDNFVESFKKLTSYSSKKSVINLLLNLSSGWRPKKRNTDTICGNSSHIIKQFKVETLYIICTIDIIKELQYIQVLKVWDMLPLEDVLKLVTHLDNIFVKYTDDYINRCKEKCLEGELEIPRTWAASSNIVQVKNLTEGDSEKVIAEAASDSGTSVENSKVIRSLLQMKFYSLSSGVVRHLLSDCDSRELDIPFEVTEEQLEMILFPRSSFILGRSGTGKTTVLTMKLFQKEKVHHIAMEGFPEGHSCTPLHACHENESEDGVRETKRDILHQLFVTASPNLCFAVKQHFSQMKSSAFGGKFPAESSLIDIDDIDDAAQFKDIPNSFVDIPAKSYPLVITFHKFLMMLDGTLGNSYFERFHDIRKRSDGQILNFRSVSLQNFIRTKEVNYERFRSSYWPHLNSRLTKKLDSLRVFTEIISHIKGSLQSIEVGDGKLNREDYVQLLEMRVSTLSKEKRGIIYEIFESYEQMKMRNDEFDLADLVIDLHRRLREGSYRGDEIHFIYVDEVQDLTMSQIALLKYICGNVEEGFVFSGDTAQSIARGIDFRFQDMRSMFYKKFVLESKSNGIDVRNEKGQLPETFSLSQNFHTHAGVLKLSQSIIDLLYRFFPHSVDVLNTVKSPIYGEPPVLLESGTNKNAITTIFGNSGNVDGNVIGFGAEQVILVRDDCAKKKISGYVGKQALVLTIVESKGLEFQDVLLYNFFGSSPLKNQWRVIYEYMKEQDLLDSSSLRSFPSFNEAKHKVLCSELKHLYVAITRARQRLWICENIEDLSKPMFDYWKKQNLVHVMQVDDSLAQAMQVASSLDDWKSRGIKLFYEHIYEMATTCFERAQDTYWEGRSKATGLKAAADRIRSSNPEEANVILREAAEIFEAIGNANSAAKCFYDLGEYERAGSIYFHKCEESKVERAGECFFLAGRYELAAYLYAKGKCYSECLYVCSEQKLYDLGLQYINYWKQDVGLVSRSKEINKVEKDFLQSGALHYHELEDSRSMMKFVTAFHSMDLIRNFLKSLSCYDELLLLEEESGNFMDAANIAKLRGDILLAAKLLQKAGNFKEACLLNLNYVLSNSLWSPGSIGWPLKQFSQKEELLEKSKSWAINGSFQFYDFVCTEADILSYDQSDLYLMRQQLNDSKRHQSISGEILTSRKILDVHLHTNASEYGLEDKPVLDLITYSEETISENRVSVHTLIHFWNCWKDKIVSILEYLQCLKTQNVKDHRRYGNFCLNYLGVWKQDSDPNTIYLVLNSDADWMRELDKIYAPRSGKLVSVDVHQLVSAAGSYWSSELLSVGMKVLNNLKALYNLSSQNSSSVFCQVNCFTCIYEVAKFLYCRYHDAKIQTFVELSTEQFFDFMFPLDSRISLTKNMISLRGTEVCRNIVQELISKYIGWKDELSYGQIGCVAVMILGFGKLSNDLYGRLAKRFHGNTAWKEFVESLSGNMRLESFHGSASCHNFNELIDTSYILKFHGALVDICAANWSRPDCISPACFLYLIERLLIMLSSLRGYFFATNSSLIDWLIYQEASTYSTSIVVTDVQQSLGGVLEFVVNTVQQYLCNEKEMTEWTRKFHTKIKDCHSLVVLRLVVIICLLHLNFGNCENILPDLLAKSYISNKLPKDFCRALRRRKKCGILNAVAEALKKIDNPLVIVSLGDNCPKFGCPDAIFVDMKISKCKEDECPKFAGPKIKVLQVHTGATKLEATNLQRRVLSPTFYEQGKSFNLSFYNSVSLQDQEVNTLNVKPGGCGAFFIPAIIASESQGLGNSNNQKTENKGTANSDVASLPTEANPVPTKKQGNSSGKAVKQKNSSTNEANIMAQTISESPIPNPPDTDSSKGNHESLSQPHSEPKKVATKGKAKQAAKKQDSFEKELQGMQGMLEKLKIEKEKTEELLKEKDEMLKMKEEELEGKGKEQEKLRMELKKLQREQNCFEKDLLEKFKIEKQKTEGLLKEKDDMLKIKDEELERKGKEHEELQMELKKLKKKQGSFENEMRDMLEKFNIEKEKTEGLLKEKDEMLKTKEEELQMELKKLRKRELKPNMTFPISQSLTEQDKKDDGWAEKKCPAPSYILRCKDQWIEVKKENPEAEFKQIPNILGATSKNVGAEEKKTCEEKCQAEKKAYLPLIAKEKHESEAMKLLEDLEQKTAMEFLEQYLQFKQEAEKENKNTKKEKDRLKPKHPVSKQRRAALQRKTKMFWRWQKKTKKESRNMTEERRKASEEIANKKKERYNQETEGYDQMKDEEALNLKLKKEELMKLQKQEALQLPKMKEKTEDIIEENKGKCQKKKQKETEEALQLLKKKEKTEIVMKKNKGKRRKKKQQETYPNKPKMPASAFLLFREEVMKTLRKDCPGNKKSTINKLIQVKWKELSKKEKQVWNAKEAEAMEAYKKKLEEYNKSVAAMNEKVVLRL